MSRSTPVPMPSPAPASPDQRSQWLDALRGFALLGIVLYNIQAFGGYIFRGLLPPMARIGEALDPTLDFWAHVLVQGKFYSLFSFLFGLGVALQLQRMQASGHQALGVLRRRMGWLLVFGLAHALLLWFGDILTVYALFGFALLALRRLSQGALLAAALCMLALPVPIYLVLLVMQVGDPLAGGPSGSEFILQALRAVSDGSYLEVVRTNLTFYPFGWLRRAAQLSLPRIFGMFLLGVWAARAGLPKIGPPQQAMLGAWLGCAVAFGLPFNIAFSIMGGNDVLYPVSAVGLLVVALESIGMPMLCMGYVAVFGLYWRSQPHSLLVAAGRTAFSHYLGQSVVCVALFYGFGLGLFGRLSYSVSLLVAVV
ncbi:MAG TPA: DUF418 domain-containing protein, partial [Xanthomonadaceae bacterium]|nr:DUF418 domain-containing protein [Xanthomonadaceae bacterium]